ncbi:MAG: S9 family peptidase [Mycobacterium sp.]|uniref:S9 family peptidase n=1 Tax=Mycobacterium sp. TaxID=1785 RepID=UPI003CC63CFE
MTSTAFGSLDEYLALPRVSGLAVSPDGSRLVTTVAELNEKRTEYVSAVWEIDPAGRAPARRLTRSAKGESSPAFSADGDLLFVSSRPVADKPGGNTDKPPASLWRLPGAGGEAIETVTMPGGVSAVSTARAAEITVVVAPLLPSARDIDHDRQLRELRKSKQVTAILHSGYPIRYWDEDLGPDEPHLLDADGPRDLIPQPGRALRDATFDVSPDGRFLVTTWPVAGPGPVQRSVLLRVELASGEHSIIADDPDADLENPAISPDGSAVAFTRESVAAPDRAPQRTLQYQRFGDQPTPLAVGWDRWPASVLWSIDGASLIVTADQAGRTPVFVVETATSRVTQLTDDDFAYTDVVTAPGGLLYALRSAYGAPPHPVRIDTDGVVTVLPCVDLPTLPGTVEDIAATAADGTSVRSWLVLPDDQQPAPLLLWIHGGPLGSWNSWSWRWNPWLLAARGYAVLLPDPALSTGYGQDFIQRGWGAWGGAPFDDLMAATEAACAHPQVDATRTAAMGGSFGGYLANWVAGHTDRFSAIVTHASLWALDQFVPTTDVSYYWRRELTPDMVAVHSPHRFVDQISTPMLVIHGDKDYRVPIGEGIRLWYELLSMSALPADEHGDSPHRFLYFPSEHHWVVAPQHTKLWYEVVIAFLAEHVLGEAVELPEILGVPSRR